MFDVAVNALAPRGRLIVIGMMSQYADGWAARQYPGACGPAGRCPWVGYNSLGDCDANAVLAAPLSPCCCPQVGHLGCKSCVVSHLAGHCPLPHPSFLPVNHHPTGIAEKLLWKSATLQGFFLLHFASQWRRHLRKLAGQLQGGRLRVQVKGVVGPREGAQP